MQKIRKTDRRILLVEPCFKNFGGYFRAIGIAKALAGEGVFVDLLISSNKKIYLGVNKTKINKYLTQYELPRISINFFINGRILRGLIATLFMFIRRYDIIHLFAIVQFESNLPLLFGAPFFRKKIIVDWDDYWSGIHETIPFYAKFGGIIAKYFRFAEYRIQKMARFGTATSEFLIDEFHKIGIDRTLKLINCVDKHEFSVVGRIESRKKLGLNPKEKILLTFGNTFFKERTIFLFRFIEALVERDKSVQFYINFDPKNLIKENAKGTRFKENVFENVHNVGYMDKKQLALYLGATDAVIFLMGESTYEKACFPIRIGAYLNGEAAIITNETETEACRTLKENCCAITDPSLARLAAKTIEFLGNKKEQEVVKANVIRAKAVLSWESQIRRLLVFYNSVAEES